MYCIVRFYAISSPNFHSVALAEEIFQTHIAHWWSPDGLRLAYATINDTLVPKMEIPMFTGTPYPVSQEYRYPKVKGHNSVLFFNSPVKGR